MATEEDRVAGQPHDPRGHLLIRQWRRGPTLVRASRSAGRAPTWRRGARPPGTCSAASGGRRTGHGPGGASATGQDPGRPPATRRAARSRGTARARGHGATGPPARHRTAVRSGGPHDAREQDPGHDREREHADDPRMEHGQDPALAGRRRGHPEDERDRRGERDERRRDHGEQHVLDHVHREEDRVVAVDPGQQRDGDRGHAQAEGRRPSPRHGVGWMRRVHRSDRPPPPAHRDDDGERG